MVEARWSFGGKELSPKPDLKLGDKVLNVISSRCRELGWRSDRELLDPQDIFFPSVNFIGDERGGVLRGMDQQDLLSVIFVAGKEHAVVKNEINFSEERGLFSGIPELRIGLGELLPASDKRIGMAIYFSCRKKISIPNMVSLDRLGPKPGISDVGFISPTEKQVLLIAGSDDGIPNVATVVLPADFRTAFENGKLIGGGEEKQIKPELKEQTEDHEVKLQDEVVRRIKKHLQELGVGKMSEELDPRDISVPPVSNYNKSELENKTQEALDRAHLPGGFPVIYVGEEKPKSILVAGTPTLYSTRFVLELSTDSGDKNYISSLRYSHNRNPSVFINYETNTEFRLGTDSSAQIHVLLILGKDGKYETSSVALPFGWMSVFDNDGRLLKKPAEPTKYVSPSAVVLTETKKTAEPIPQLTFPQMAEKVKSFPFYRGPAENKEGIRTASFGKAKTPVEITVADNNILANGAKVSLKFFNLNAGELKEVCEKKKLNLLTLASCFKPGFESKDNLVLEVSLDTNGQMKTEGRIVRWDIDKGGDVDSLQYFSPDFRTNHGVEIMGIINDKDLALPYFFSQLEAPKIEGMSVEEAIDQMKIKQTEVWRGNDSWGGKVRSGGNNTERPAPTSTVEELLQNETLFPENISPSYTGNPRPGFKDRSPEEKKRESEKYWTQKKGKGSKKSGKSKKGK